jgi:hypothetical protein
MQYALMAPKFMVLGNPSGTTDYRDLNQVDAQPLPAGPARRHHNWRRLCNPGHVAPSLTIPGQGAASVGGKH